ncbi:MAG: DUF86 domain-containing protein [Candidatus Omnitrophica bacterium]|nr:DUF86 domain-containing protein [Candidatus Omnitrophota bacterium]
MNQTDKAKIIPSIEYLEKELSFLPLYENEIDWKVYELQRSKRLELERWVECIINATLDIVKVLIVVKGEILPETSREVLFHIASCIYDKEEDAHIFSQLAKIRNTLAHRYLDVKWQDIKKFINVARTLYPAFLNNIKNELKK